MPDLGELGKPTPNSDPPTAAWLRVPFISPSLRCFNERLLSGINPIFRAAALASRMVFRPHWHDTQPTGSLSRDTRKRPEQKGESFK